MEFRTLEPTHKPDPTTETRKILKPEILHQSFKDGIHKQKPPTGIIRKTLYAKTAAWSPW